MATILSQGPHLRRWVSAHCRHSVGRMAGKPIAYEPWEDEFFDEAFEVDPETGLRVYTDVLFGLARKNAKSEKAAAASLYLAGPDDEQGPLVILGAPSRDNTQEVFNAATGMINLSPTLRRSYTPERYQILCPSTRGVIRRAAADGKAQHGSNPHGVVVDELHGFTTERQKEALTAWTSGSMAREQPLRFFITTAGYDLATPLGEMYQRAMNLDDLEERRPGLVVARDREAGFLCYWYSAPLDAPIDSLETWQMANPASWLSFERYLAELHSPMRTEGEARRLYLNQWTSGREQWIATDRWRACTADIGEPGPGADVFVGIDGSRVHDATVVARAWRLEDARIAVDAHVWSARSEAPHHTLCRGGKIDYDLVEAHLRSLGAAPARLAEVVYDPRYLGRTADMLSDELGVPTAPLEPQSRQYRDMLSALHRGVVDGTLAHAGDPVIEKHLTAAVAREDDRGWVVSKRRASSPIDATIAIGIAFWRCSLGENDAGFEAWG